MIHNRIQDRGYSTKDTGYKLYDAGKMIQDAIYRIVAGYIIQITQDTKFRIQNSGYRKQ